MLRPPSADEPVALSWTTLPACAALLDTVMIAKGKATAATACAASSRPAPQVLVLH